MTYIIYKNGVEENRIVADEAFCAEHYSSNGYSYELEPELEPDPDPVNPTEEERLRADIDYMAAYLGVEL